MLDDASATYARESRVVPLSPSVGAEIQGIDLSRPLSREEISSLRESWHQHGVLLFRDQCLTKSQLVTFSASFGTPVTAAHQERALTSTCDSPQVMIVSNVIENGQPIGHLGNKEAFWHTDMCYTDDPPIASILYAINVPASGGNTGFMNMYDVYDRLPGRLRERIATLSIKHDRSYTAVGDLRHGYEHVTDASKSPGSIHPLLKRHPETGRVALYLGRRLHAYVVGMSLSESEALLDELWQYADVPGTTWHHAWRARDLLMWDNRCLMHRRDSFDQNECRIMWRTQVRAACTA